MRARRTVVLATVLAPVVGLGWFTASASAFFTGVQRVGATSVSSSANKGVTVACPAGKKVTSAGVDVNPVPGDVLVDDIRPDATLTKVTVRAVEDETGTSANWTVTALAICAPPAAGLQRVAAVSASSSTDKSVAATCPAGKRVLGTGGETSGADRQLLLDGLAPSADLASVTVNAVEDGTGTAGTWTVTAYAICAGPVTGVERTAQTSVTDSSISKVVTGPCPTGKVLVGTGGEINSANGQVVLDAAFPTVALDGAGFAAWEDDTGNAGTWSLTSYAICAGHAERIVAASPTDTGSKQVFARCPAGKGLTGLGADIGGGFGLAYFNTLLPSNQPPPDLLSVFASGQGSRGWSTRAFALCATSIASVEFVSAEGSPVGLGDQKQAVVACPAGKKLLGAGSQTLNSAGSVAVQRITPRSDLLAVTVAASEVLTDIDNGWRLVGWALCATPPPGLQLVRGAVSAAASEELDVATARCPAGKHVTGAGGEVTPATGKVILDDLRPDAALSSVTVTGIEAGNGTDADWTATAYAICMNR